MELIHSYLKTDIWRFQVPSLEICAVIEIMEVTAKPQIAFNVAQGLLSCSVYYKLSEFIF